MRDLGGPQPVGDQLAKALAAAVDRLGGDLIGAVADAIRIPSVNPRYPGEDYDATVGGEGRVGRHVAALYRRAGCEVDVFGTEPGRENTVGVLRGDGGGRSLIYNGHIDVVPPGPHEDWTGGDAWSGRHEAGRIWGRGASDMKAGVVAQAFAALALAECGVRLAGDLILEAVVGEETMEHTLGTTACVERGYRADGAVVAEPSAPPVPLGIIPVTPGVTRFIVTVKGRRTHPALRSDTIWPGGGGADVGVNAIDKAFLLYEAMRRLEYNWALTKRSPLFRPGQFGVQPGVFVGSPRGQFDPFFIPDHAWIDYIVLYPPGETIDVVRAEIESIIDAVANADPWLRVHRPEVEWKHHWPPSAVDPEHELVHALARAHSLATGRVAEVHAWTAVHDGTFLNAAGIPTISYGPGDVALAHAPDESVAVDELVAAVKTYAVLAASWCGVTSVALGSPT
jgi:acetylornithine deacetylase